MHSYPSFSPLPIIPEYLSFVERDVRYSDYTEKGWGWWISICYTHSYTSPIFRAHSSSTILSGVLGASQLTCLQYFTFIWLNHRPLLHSLLSLLIMSWSYRELLVSSNMGPTFLFLVLIIDLSDVFSEKWTRKVFHPPCES